MADQDGELAVVVFADEGAAGWQPTQVFTRKWIRLADASEGWTYTLYDGTWCARDEQLHLYQAGGGPPYVEGPAYLDGKLYMHQIWLAPGESVSSNTAMRPEGGLIADRRKPGLTDSELLAIGYQRIHEHPGDIFSSASDERTTWCEKCEDYIPPDDSPCEHMTTCWHCCASYTAGDSEERRCPECNESQLECEECETGGAERCTSCGRSLCKGCWPNHDGSDGDPCERGAADWKEPPLSKRAAQREAKRRRTRQRKRRGW